MMKIKLYRIICVNYQFLGIGMSVLSHKKIESTVLPQSKSKKSLEPELPNIYIQSHNKKASLLPLSMMKEPKARINYQPHTVQARAILRQAITKHLNLKNANQTYSRFLSQELVQAVSEDIKAVHYNDEKCLQVMKLIQEVFGQEVTIGERQVLIAQGKVTKKNYVFFTSAFYQPYSFCCDSVAYASIYNPHQVMEILSPFQPPQQYMIDFICSNCKKKILRLHRKVPQKKTKVKINQQDENNNSFTGGNRFHSKSLLPKIPNQSRQKINTTIMIASGRYKKIRLNQSLIEKKKSSILNLKHTIETSLKDHRQRSLIFAKLERKKLKRIKNQIKDDSSQA